MIGYAKNGHRWTVVLNQLTERYDLRDEGTLAYSGPRLMCVRVGHSRYGVQWRRAKTA